MLRVIYIGEEITAQGLRLLGVTTLTPNADHSEVLDALTAARGDGDLVLLDRGLADLVDTELRQLLFQYPVPPILVIPDMKSSKEFPSVELELARRELGIGAHNG